MINLLAIIIPYYKLTFFRETLESLAAQTDQRFHVYIGNDASPEDPESLLKEFEGRFSLTYNKFNENLGGISLAQQWERCIDMMQGEEWFMILGDDDILSENVVSDFFLNRREIKELKISVLRFSTQLINSESQAISNIFTQPKFENPLNSLIRKWKGNNRSSLSEFIFKISKYRKYGFKRYSLAWSTDDRAVIDFSDGNNIYSFNTSVVQVRMSLLNISSNKTDRELKEISNLQFIRDLLSDYRKNMDLNQIQFFIQVYEHRLFTTKVILTKDLFFISILFLMYMPLKKKLYIIKAIFKNSLKRRRI